MCPSSPPVVVPCEHCAAACESSIAEVPVGFVEELQAGIGLAGERPRSCSMKDRPAESVIEGESYPPARPEGRTGPPTRRHEVTRSGQSHVHSGAQAGEE